ncbi:MAG: peptidase M75 family protein [Actinomycetales bacterium]|nr:peptidase M75 family protein [Actinomycetales bacterium]
MPSRPSPASARSPIALGALAATAVLVLSGCVPNAPAGGTSIAVDIRDDACEVETATAEAGTVVFSLSNTGSDVNEFEILADDGLRIVGEKENVVPGQTVDYAVQLEPGSYVTACKFRQVGEPVGRAAFTVTGEAVVRDADEQQLADEAVASYLAYLRSQVGELIPAVAEFAEAYAAGDDEKARELFAAARVPYERIEPTAEAFGDLDPSIDYREVDALAEGLDWTGFHRMEKDLWPPHAGDLNSDGADALLDWSPSTPEERRALADGLVADVDRLAQLVRADDFTLSVDDISNGAIGLLDEVAAGKITGEEDWWSHTDLSDFAANVQGARVAFGTVRELAETAGGAEAEQLTTRIDREFDALEALLAQYGDLDAGFTPYDQVDAAQRKELSDQVNALAEPLSQLTALVLGS